MKKFYICIIFLFFSIKGFTQFSEYGGSYYDDQYGTGKNGQTDHLIPILIDQSKILNNPFQTQISMLKINTLPFIFTNNT